MLRVSSPYGDRINPVTGVEQHHDGIDLPMPVGTPVIACAPGFVRRVRYGDPVSGNSVWLRLARGWSAFYLHLSTIDVAAGAVVPGGAVLGRSGATGRVTGPHLHFAISTPAGDYVDPVTLFPPGTFRSPS